MPPNRFTGLHQGAEKPQDREATAQEEEQGESHLAEDEEAGRTDGFLWESRGEAGPGGRFNGGPAGSQQPTILKPLYSLLD